MKNKISKKKKNKNKKYKYKKYINYIFFKKNKKKK